MNIVRMETGFIREIDVGELRHTISKDLRDLAKYVEEKVTQGRSMTSTGYDNISTILYWLYPMAMITGGLIAGLQGACEVFDNMGEEGTFIFEPSCENLLDLQRVVSNYRRATWFY